MGLIRPVRRRWVEFRDRRAGRRLVFPMAAGFWMLAAAAAAAAAIWVTTAWLLGVADDAAPGTERAKVRVDAVRTGLAAGAGAGAAVGLMLAFRRQGHQEYDTAERRVTELYNAAAEQLGSDKAPVRLTALYTLERLANDNPRHRQTIVNIVCAYLRMPFQAEEPGIVISEEELTGLNVTARVELTDKSIGLVANWQQERHVRLTAQRILHTHLRRAAAIHWVDIDLDLTGAALIEFSLRECTMHTATFGGATFSGGADFSEATFGGSADFGGATFSSDPSFDSAYVADRGQPHELAPGWRIEPAEGTRGLLVPGTTPPQPA